ncbi:Na+/H+ antiporter NhaA [Chondromyces apiculatus]|uniref:Na(+)/H(+) antiporter NhaA n=1 Tax=Chondromyces apiculatus DSM 436 TaxID=1192034 RepID=A0A017T0S3_9BACT|nr:Na+/H+ antiporter NhaA [Chondromyces apiculatus]EYF02146.1 Na+/H+ antiporter NhaA type [Chondromyces apiculatus DSM 436]
MAAAGPRPIPPEAWPRAHRIAQGFLRPLGRFLHVQAASGVVLLVASVLALAWANSPWAASYEHLWHTPIIVGVGSFVLREPLHFWINDALMTVFFFVVGLEIRREIHEGELADLRRATLPIAAALGGMLAPALIYMSLNREPPGHRGWGVPTATDIAFAVGVLTLLGKRVPSALRVLLLALAIIDDIGAIVVIAVFYTSGVAVEGLVVAAGGILSVLAMQRFGVRKPLLYVAPGAVIWWGMLRSGVHPTLAGVVLGLLTPARPWFGQEGFLSAAKESVAAFEQFAEDKRRDVHELLEPLMRLGEARGEALAPVVRLQAWLHPYVAFGVMPLFALANAGVDVRGVTLDAPGLSRVMLGVIVGLTVGKPIGIVTASWLSVTLGIASLPRGVKYSGVFVVGCVAGIGFTMAIFVAGLAFNTPEMLGAAKLAVLLASSIAAGIGMLAARLILPAQPALDVASTTPDEAEKSNEY